MAIAGRIAPSAPRGDEQLVERTGQFVEQATGLRVKSTPIDVNRVPI